MYGDGVLIRDPKRLARSLLLLGYTQRELAAALGYRSHTSAGRLMRGQARYLDLDTAAKLAGLLGVTVYDLVVDLSVPRPRAAS